MAFGFIKDIASTKDSQLIAGLDIGTTKVSAVVGEINISGKAPGRETNSSSIRILGVGTSPTRGIKKGIVTNIEAVVESIRSAVNEAETSADVDIKAVYVGITGGHIGCLSSHGVIAVKEREIGQKEINSVIDAAKAVAIPFDREILHVIPAGYTVNGENGITDPRGMAGVRLETNVQIITAAATSVQNLVRSCQKAGLEVIEVVFQPLASAGAVLTHDEKNLGVALIDIGGGTTDMALFHEGNICHSRVFTVGGNNFTNDLAIGLRIPSQEAEDIKKRYGCSMISLVKDDEEIEVRHTEGKIFRKIPRRYLVEILQPRAEELFTLIKEEITDKGFHKYMNSGVVLTGGAVLMEGMDVMAENILELPVRIGKPECIESTVNGIDNPVYATGAGLVVYGAAESLKTEGLSSNGNILSGITNRVKGWIKEIF
jgi:cell division protein FtsA